MPAAARTRPSRSTSTAPTGTSPRVAAASASASASAACDAALAAAKQGLAAIAERNRRNRDGEPALRIGIALHYGTVSYGNIGTDDRLDFTVIGPDVNLVSRIEHFCRELDRSLIMSQAFAEALGRPMWELGHFNLRGFAKMHRLFELPPEEG